MTIEKHIVKITRDGVHGTGFMVAPDTIITCKHLSSGISQKEPVSSVKYDDLNISTESNEHLYVETILVHPAEDIALLKLKNHAQSVTTTVFLSELPWHRLVKLDLSALGYGGTSGSLRKIPSLKVQGTVLNKKGDLDNIQFGTGAIEGMSGGPVYVESDGNMFIVGMLYLGGERAPSSRMIASNILCAFLEENRIIPKKQPAWQALPPVRTLPHEYVERPQHLNSVKAQLLAGKCAAIGTAFTGVGGFGKTVLAAALCNDKEVRKFFVDGIHWITLGEKPEPSAKDQFSSLAQRILPDSQSSDFITFS
jgi:hypothetical protein